jgi:hypothetical protein
MDWFFNVGVNVRARGIGQGQRRAAEESRLHHINQSTCETAARFCKVGGAANRARKVQHFAMHPVVKKLLGSLVNDHGSSQPAGSSKGDSK